MEAVREIATFQEGGRGKKQCPACKIFLGVRNARCVCGHEFGSKPRILVPRVQEPVEIEEDEDEPDSEFMRPDNRCRVIAIPAGKCPVPLTSTDPDEIRTWALEILERGHQESIHYQLSAVRYWIRDFYTIHSREYREVVSRLHELFPTAI